MRKVWRDIADINPLESDNKMVTYHSWLACPLQDLQADSRTCVCNGGAPLMPPRYLHLELPKHAMRNVSRFCLRAHTLAVESSIWRAGNGHCDKCSCAAVQNEMHLLFLCQDLLVCCRRKKYLFPFFPFCWSFSMETPYTLQALLSRLSLITFLNGATNSAIPFRTLWTIFWPSKTSNKPISQTTRLAVKPNLCHSSL